MRAQELDKSEIRRCHRYGIKVRESEAEKGLCSGTVWPKSGTPHPWWHDPIF